MAPGAHLVVLKALDVTGNGFTSNVIAAIDYAIANRTTLQHPRPQPVGRGRRLRVVHQGSLDPRRQARRRLGHRRRRRRGQPRPGSDGTAAVRRHHVAGQRALGADRRRDGRSRHGRSRRRCGRRLQLSRTRGDRRERQARSRRAWRQHRIDCRPVERALRRASVLAPVGHGEDRERALLEPDRARAWPRPWSPAPSR